MNRRKIELYVGLFVIAGLVAAGYLITIVGEFTPFAQKRYSLYGYFSSVSGLKSGARVEVAGVEIGNISSITIDRKRMVAKVVFDIDQTIELSEDIIASVKTSGIIGEKYIDIAPGGSDVLLEDGNEIENTESSLDIESLIRKFIFSSDNKSKQ